MWAVKDSRFISSSAPLVKEKQHIFQLVYHTYFTQCDLAWLGRAWSSYIDSVVFSFYRLTLLLGPPGAGKTTLLKALAGVPDKDIRVSDF